MNNRNNNEIDINATDRSAVEEDEDSESNFFFSFEDTEEEDEDVDESSTFGNNRNHEYEKSIYVRQKPVIDAEDLHFVARKGPQILTSLCVSSGCLCYGMCIGFSSPTIPFLVNNNTTFTITLDQATWMSSLLCIGALFGSLSAVFLMDAIGRKASLLAFSVMSLFIGWTLLMAASQVWQLCVGRFLLGLGAGLEISISPVYIHETTRPNMRDICGSFPQIMTAMGLLLSYMMGRSFAWNWLSLISCVAIIPFTFGLYYIPESPPWLLYNGEEDLAFKSMPTIRGDEYDAAMEISQINAVLSKHKHKVSALASLDNFLSVAEDDFHPQDLLTPSVLKPFLVTLVLMFLLQLSGQGAVTFYTGLIFQEARITLDPNNCALIIGLTYLISSILSLILKNLIGRRVLLLLSQCGMGMTMIATGVYFNNLGQTYENSTNMVSEDSDEIRNITIHVINTPSDSTEDDDDNLPSWWLLPVLQIYTFFYNIGLGSLTWTVATEILPPRSRIYTHTIANIVSNLFWFMVTKTFHDIQEELGYSAPFFMYGSVCLFGILYIYIFVPETRGKTMEEIAQNFQR